MTDLPLHVHSFGPADGRPVVALHGVSGHGARYRVVAERVEAELAEHLVTDGDRLRYRYCQSAAVVAWSEMARPAVPPPAGTRTLLLPAAKADFVAPAWVVACRAELGDALTVTEVGAGHMLFLERTAEVAQLVRAFLTS